ncbi:FGGY-family carbohydrate kinase [Cognatishimia maritima]|uniref:Xylulokinase n=1 Tax=Cognatishimia maritima TaxID=870908 RepID=A0A1M5VL76_9RHOB|nr:FGGY family carbohydrate kinase [Cognatishimia maritima]SHH75989.1 xylulokinase [Cognatishimia maritima]
MADFIAAIDCGTTGAKAIIFDTTGTWHGTAYQEYPCDFPAPNRVEQDAEALFEACVDVLAKAVGKSGVEVSAIKALSFSTQRCTLIAVDENCSPLRPAISWQDNRSEKQCDVIRESIGDKAFYATTGLPIANVWTLPSIMWIRDEEPEIYAKTHKFLNPHGFLLKRMGADNYVEDLSNASLHGLVSVARGDWDDDFIATTNVEKAKLPDLVTSGTVVGTLASEIAERTGLTADTLLVAGGGDQQSAGIGAGVIKSGIGSVTLGTAGVVICSFDEPPFDPNGAIPAEIHAYPGKFICEGLQTTAGAALKWLRNVAKDASRGAEVEYEMFNEMAVQATPGSDGLLFLPYLAGAGAPQWNGYATGTFHGLTQGHGLGEMARAVMEGVAFQNALILSEFEKSGRSLSEIRLTGGGAKSKLWSQIQADIYGRPVHRLKEDEAGLLGAAILAAFGAGIFTSIDDGVGQMVRTQESYTPDPDRKTLYAERLTRFSDLYDMLYR